MILAINTGSENNSIALYSPPKIMDEVIWQTYPTSPRFKSGLRGTSKTQSQELLPKIDKLLTSNKVKMSDIKAIAVYQGPGSYTGLRVGISVANALAWSLNLPIIGIKDCHIVTLSHCHKKNQFNNLTIQQYNNMSASEIAKKAQEIYLNEDCTKYVEAVEPCYGSTRLITN